MSLPRPTAVVWTLLAIAAVVAVSRYASRPPAQPPTSAATRPVETPAEPEEPNPVLAAQPSTRPIDPRIAPVLDALQEHLSTYKEHPVGSNAEITAALLGENPRKLVALSRDKATLDKDDQLLDPWGKPYFFHQLSARVLEVRSGGPDGKLRTDDDILLISQD